MNKKGFTLVELLIVIAIIGVLASIVLVSMGSARAKARDAVRSSDLRQITSGMEMYYGDNNAYPTLAGTALPTSISTYMAKVPADPKNTGNYVYKWVDNTGTGNDQKFCIYATMETGCSTGQTRYFASSYKGTSEVACTTTAPTWTIDCP